MVAARYYDGRSARRHDVRLGMAGGRLRVIGNGIDMAIPLAEVDFGEPLGRGPRVVELPDGARCEVDDAAALAALQRSAGRGDGLVVGLQSRWRWALAGLAVVVSFAVAGYRWGLPAAARAIAPRVPPAFAQTLSDNVLAQLDRQVLQPSALPAERQARLRALAAAHLTEAGQPPWRIHFRAAKTLGPNALALPAGDIVVLDKLALLFDERELVAVVAHEIGHLAHRHGMQQLIQGTALSILMAAWLGDVSSAAVAFGSQLLLAGYSRDAEQEADLYAAHLLDRCCGDRTGLVGALEKLDRHGENDGPSWFGSHPETAARIEAIRRLPRN